MLRGRFTKLGRQQVRRSRPNSSPFYGISKFEYIDWYHYSCNPGDIDCGFNGDGSSTAVSGSLGLVARLNEAATRWSPYIIAGVATYYFGGTDGPLTWMRPNHFGFQGGAGFCHRTLKCGH
jgi:hypothetical protein